MTKLTRVGALLPVLVATVAAPAGAAGLGGSKSSMTRQHAVAVELDYTFLRTRAQLEKLVEQGSLERVAASTDDYALSNVSHPYARPEIHTFIERLAAQYHAATGQRLVVTSLVRPTAEQPSNASRLSVHPAGMAVDLRIPAEPSRRAWLERTLLELEQAGVLDVTREKRPPHYHVAVFPAAYAAYMKRQPAAPKAAAAPAAPVTVAAAPVAITPAAPSPAPSNGTRVAPFVIAIAVLGATLLGATRYSARAS